MPSAPAQRPSSACCLPGCPQGSACAGSPSTCSRTSGRMSYEYTPLVTQPRVDLCFVGTPWHDGHILAALEAGDSVQHPPMRLDALPLGDLGDLAVDVQHAEDSSQIQR